ncbi:trypsin-like peptidase domain-containing protein [Oceaniglobus roseus]|uniref:trypsin-like peptidase domain-containing protein n=1 Tax=Oceaniglobus roseus TaxID=1737570 RepID=UPI000C7EF8F3|nr:trypsin-like peptidase domain-containing protein [Kandeliimicrobium roseum]
MQVFIRIAAVALFVVQAGAVVAQGTAWLQIEAQPSLERAKDSAARYARRIEDVAGFRLGSTNWYAVVIGPATATGAANLRSELRGRGLIPGDSFVTDGGAFSAQFWPEGGTPAAEAAPAADPEAPEATAAAEAPEAASETAPETAAAPTPDPEPVQETPREARESESQLSESDRKLLQVALQWAGFYDAAIDGDFGRGTRSAMGEWQAANGYDVTGILTTRQRTALLAAYNEILAGLGMEEVRDDTAGIEIRMPTALVGFDSYEPPFAHYGPHDGGTKFPKVLLISQRGDTDTLFGLYDIMQTLEIVPETGAREKGRNSFVLVGEGTDFISHTEASVNDGAVKGFTLIWPTGDEKRRQRVLEEMRRSFTSIPGTVMGDLAGEPGEDQSVNLLAGLEIRMPETSRSGFYIDPRGNVLTTSTAVGQCKRITLNEEIEAEVTAVDDRLGLALLKPKQALAPRTWARFQPRVPRLQSDVVLAGYSYEGILGAPTLTFGTLADLRGLQGEEEVKRLALAARAGDAGGPVLDETGAVLGMLVPGRAPEGQALPDDVSFLADVDAIAGFLSANGLSAAASDASSRLKAGVLSDIATDMTVLVSCWQ